MSDDKKEITQIRMGSALKNRVRRYQEKVTRQTQGVKISFGEAVRVLVERGLDCEKL